MMGKLVASRLLVFIVPLFGVLPAKSETPDFEQYKMISNPADYQFEDYLRAIEVPDAKIKRLMNNGADMLIRYLPAKKLYNIDIIPETGVKEDSLVLRFELEKEKSVTWLNGQNCVMVAAQLAEKRLRLSLRFPTYNATTEVDYRHNRAFVKHSALFKSVTLTFTWFA